jgi:hypothetical protein
MCIKRTIKIIDCLILKSKQLNIQLLTRKTNKAPKGWQINGNNPSKEELLQRMGGLNEISKLRMVPTNENKWCVYWRPSLMSK